MRANFLSRVINEDRAKFRYNRGIYFIILFYPAAVLLNSFYWMIINYKKKYVDLAITENYPVELTTLVVILVSVFFGIRLVIEMKKRGVELFKIIFVSLMTFALFFVAMEEISWGQWLFKFKSPEYFRFTNLQKETNIHNLRELHVIFEYIRVIIGVGGFLSIFLNNTRAFKYISSPFVLSLAFIVITVFSAIDVYTFYFPNQWVLLEVGTFWWFIKFNMEIIEMMIAISALVFLWSNTRRLRYETS